MVLGIMVSSSMWPWGWRRWHTAGPWQSPDPPPLLPFLAALPGPLRSMVEDLQSEESDEDDSSSGEEASGKANAGRDSRCPGR